MLSWLPVSKYSNHKEKVRLKHTLEAETYNTLSRGRMIDKIKSDYKKLYGELKNSWNPVPMLTSYDKKIFDKKKTL